MPPNLWLLVIWTPTQYVQKRNQLEGKSRKPVLTYNKCATSANCAHHSPIYLHTFTYFGQNTEPLISFTNPLAFQVYWPSSWDDQLNSWLAENIGWAKESDSRSLWIYNNIFLHLLKSRPGPSLNSSPSLRDGLVSSDKIGIGLLSLSCLLLRVHTFTFRGPLQHAVQAARAS